jgi:hypothetical protein
MRRVDRHGGMSGSYIRMTCQLTTSTSHGFASTSSDLELGAEHLRFHRAVRSGRRLRTFSHIRCCPPTETAIGAAGTKLVGGGPSDA